MRHISKLCSDSLLTGGFHSKRVPVTLVINHLAEREEKIIVQSALQIAAGPDAISVGVRQARVTRRV